MAWEVMFATTMQTWRLRQQRIGGNVVEIPQRETFSVWHNCDWWFQAVPPPRKNMPMGNHHPKKRKNWDGFPVSLLWAAQKTELRTSRPHIKTYSPLEPDQGAKLNSPSSTHPLMTHSVSPAQDKSQRPQTKVMC